MLLRGMRLPYGIANFAEIRRGGYAYIDKTGFIPALESAEKGRRYLVFLRPRRMGKTLLLSMLEHYYDILDAPSFDALFEGLAIADAPTPERSRYAVLRLEMTGMPTSLGVADLRAAFLSRLHNSLNAFLARYAALLPDVTTAFEAGRSTDDPASLMQRFLSAMERSSTRLYLLIDEYDNFTNDLIARGDHRMYRDIVHASGFVRELYKTIKEGAARGVIARIFMTGVSPVTLDDLTSGFNITSNISLREEFNAFAGFTGDEVKGLVSGVLENGEYSLDPAAVEADLRLYYNGYLFSRDASERLFNPDMVLYFLKELSPPAGYPGDLLDINVRTDYGRIQRLMFSPEGEARPQVLDWFQTVIAEGWIDAEPASSFPLDRAYEEGYFVSLLYYMGLLTHQWDEGWPRLGIPNYAIRLLYWESIARLLHDIHHTEVEPIHTRSAMRAMAQRGDMLPFFELAYARVLRRLSTRDLIRLDEKSMKMVLLSLLSLSEVFFAFSEAELSFGYGDLLLLPSRSQPAAHYGFIVELKYLKSGARDEEVLAKLDGADAQLRRYLADPKLEGMRPPKGWKAVSAAFVATESCWVRELGGEAKRMGESA
ncbi:MAG: AAA family ATPase [Byssovorax sp.]